MERCQRAQPQVVSGRSIWPEHWGLDKQQIAALLQELRSQEDWDAASNVYDLVKGYIIPWTRGSGLGYALQLNAEAPKEVNVMVSHAWGENAEAFLESLLRSSKDEDVFFVCAFSIYQAEDGFGPSIQEQLGSKAEENPFRRVLEDIREKGLETRCHWHCLRLLGVLPELCVLGAMLLFYSPVLFEGCVPLGHECATRVNGAWVWAPLARQWQGCLPLSVVLMACWLLSRLALCCLKDRGGRMLVVPNREVDIYSRLWCVYEIFVAMKLNVPVEMARTLAFAGKVHSMHASCGCEADAARIRREIESEGYSYDFIDKAVFVVTHRARLSCLRALVTYGVRVAVTNVAFLCIDESRGQSWVDIVALLLGFLLGINCVFWVFKSAQGRPNLHVVLLCGLSLCFVSFSIGIGCAFLEPLWPAMAMYALFLIGADTLLLAFVGACCCTSYALARWKSWALCTIALGALLLLQLRHCDESFYPELVWNLTMILTFFWVPALVWWSAAQRWGVTIDPGPGWTFVSVAKNAALQTKLPEAF